MGRLNKHVYDLGARYVARGDLYNLIKWARGLRIHTLDLEKLEKTYADLFSRGQHAQARKLFEQYFGTVDPDVEFEVWRAGLLKWIAYSLAFGLSVFLFLYQVKNG